MGFIPVNEPLFQGNEKAYLAECIDSGWISSEGPFVERFEHEMAAIVERKHGIAVSSGSGALDIAVSALSIGPGDEVIVPSLSIISCAAAVVRAGAKPVLVDSDPFTWNMDVSSIEENITARTRAIMVVHTYGLPVDMNPVMEIALKHGRSVIEYAAEAEGLEYRGKPCGSFGDISVFSFYANKHITSGEGGMIVTDRQDLAERCRSLRNLCFQAEKRFFHEEMGWNYRMTNLQAAVGLAQLEQLDAHIAIKHKMGRSYNEHLAGIKGLQLPVESLDYAENIYWIYGLVIKEEINIDAAEAMQRLAKSGIGTRPFFWPIHEQPVFKDMGLFEGEQYPAAELLARRGFYLPSGLGLTDVQIESVAEQLHRIML